MKKKPEPPRPSFKPAVAPATFKRVLLIMVWKNFTMTKRRKLETMLMLFQIFLWFGWGGARFLFQGQTKWLTAVMPKEDEPLLPVYTSIMLPRNHPIAITVADHPDFH